MRQVDEAEIVWRLKYVLGRLRAGLRRDLASHNREVSRRAEQMLAVELARALRSYEMLSSAPIPPGRDLYSRAAYGLGGTGAPMIDVDDD